MNDNKPCFVISPIGESGSEVRKRADQVLRHVIEPAVSNCGYKAIRADRISEPGLITSQVIQHIIDDPLVVADLTGSNPNVFYELAIRHAIRKPLIQLIQKGDSIPFDIAGMRTIPVDHKDLDSVDEARTEMEKQIRSSEGKQPNEIDSPITFSIDLQMLRQSDNPEERKFAEFVSAITDLRSDIAGIEKRLSDPMRLIPPDYLAAVMERPTMHTKEMDMILREARSTARELLKRSGDDKEVNILAARIDEMLSILRHRF